MGPFDSGYECRLREIPICRNPYKKKSDQWISWNRGWRIANDHLTSTSERRLQCL